MSVRFSLEVAAALLMTMPAPTAAALDARASVTKGRSVDLSAIYEHALALAKITLPEDLVVSSSMREFDRNSVTVMRADPEVQELERQRPGFAERYYVLARPQLEKLTRKHLPEKWVRMGEMYATHMSIRQIDAAARFYSGSVGQKVLRLTAEDLDGQQLIEAGYGGTKDQYAKVGKRAIFGAEAKAVASMSQSERETYRQFAISPAGSAMLHANLAAAEAMANWIGQDSEVNAAMADAAKRAFDELDPMKSATAR